VPFATRECFERNLLRAEIGSQRDGCQSPPWGVGNLVFKEAHFPAPRQKLGKVWKWMRVAKMPPRQQIQNQRDCSTKLLHTKALSSL
jgi:hypothetical protein